MVYRLARNFSLITLVIFFVLAANQTCLGQEKTNYEVCLSSLVIKQDINTSDHSYKDELVFEISSHEKDKISSKFSGYRLIGRVTNCQSYEKGKPLKARVDIEINYLEMLNNHKRIPIKALICYYNKPDISVDNSQNFSRIPTLKIHKSPAPNDYNDCNPCGQLNFNNSIISTISSSKNFTIKNKDTFTIAICNKMIPNEVVITETKTENLPKSYILRVLELLNIFSMFSSNTINKQNYILSDINHRGDYCP